VLVVETDLELNAADPAFDVAKVDALIDGVGMAGASATRVAGRRAAACRARAYGYVNRSLPDGELDGFVDMDCER
jgi:hypothetical protein